MSPSYSVFVFIVVVAQGALIILYIIQMYSSQPLAFMTDRHFVKRNGRRFSFGESDMIGLRDPVSHHQRQMYHDTESLEYSDFSNIRDHPTTRHLDFGQRTKGRRPGLLRAEDYYISDSDRPSLLVAILSAPIYADRRQAIRESWMQECRQEKNVVCKFFTDALTSQGEPLDNVTMEKIQKESKRNRGDLIITDTPGGENFALRYLSVMQWAMENVEFDFLLRIDDDHYLCLERLLQELPFRPRRRLYWGHMHCYPGVVRVDDGWMMMSADLIKEFWHKRDDLMCHKYADQAVAMWIYEAMKYRDVNWFGDYRIFHHPPVAMISTFKIRKEICHTFISLHGAYPIEQRVFHMILEKERRMLGNAYEIPPVVDTCPHLRQNFNWKWFELKYHAEPVPCKNNPLWVSNGSVFLGRSLDIRERMRTERLNEERYEKNKLTIKIKREKRAENVIKNKIFNVVKVSPPLAKQIGEKANDSTKHNKSSTLGQVTFKNNKPIKGKLQDFSSLQRLNIPTNVTMKSTSPFVDVLRKDINSSLTGG